MFQPIFSSNLKIIQYVLLWIGFALLQTLCLCSILSFSFEVLLVDAFIHATIYGILGILFWNVLKYGNFNSLTVFQRIINYSTLVLLVLIISIAGGYGLEYLLRNEIISSFPSLLPLRILLTLLVYVIFIQHFRFIELKASNENIVEYEKINSISSTIELSLVNDVEINETEQKLECLERIAVRSGSKIHVIMVSDLLYLQSDGDYVQLYTLVGKFLKEQTMKYFEENLPSAMFVRVHRSYIVNVEAISRIDLYEKQSQLLTLKNGHQLKISQSGYKALRLILKL